MTCMNCNRKGHAASECRQPKRDKHERLCFTCNKAGHEARNCPGEPAVGARPIKAIEDAGARRVATECAIAEKPRAQPSQLGDFVRSAPTRPTPTSNRFQPLRLGIWQQIAADVARETSSEVINSVIVDFIHDSMVFPSLCSPLPSDDSHTSSKRVPPAPRGQGEICGSAHSAQADFNIRGGA